MTVFSGGRMLSQRRHEVEVDDLSGPAVARFLGEHVAQLRAVSPPGSSHALDLDGLSDPAVTVWVIREGGDVIACGALKVLDEDHGEVKSMRTADSRRGEGLARQILDHLLEHAVARGLRRVSLETGSRPFFAPARRLYTRAGFVPCPPFGAYREDPESVFMTRTLDSA
jgi:putative acetyltransferase